MNTHHSNEISRPAPVSPAASGGASGAGDVPPRWRWHAAVLRQLRDRLLDEQADALDAARTPLEPHSQDDADSATDEFDHDLALASLSQHRDALLEVGAALQRLHDGIYGVCEESGRPISEERLRAVPWTRYTREVAERREAEGLLSTTRLPGAASVQGPPPGGLAQSVDPEDEYAQAQARERLKRVVATRAIESGESEGEPAEAPPGAADGAEAEST